MKRFIIAALATLAIAGVAEANKPEKIIGPGLNSGRTDYFQNFNRHLSSDTTYILTGLYYVDSTFTLTIEPGTVVRGDTAATLIVRRGAKIFANGAPYDPVVFTSNQPAGSRGPGDWGGVVILGKAPVNKFEPLIEGGLIFGSYGGNDPNDNSGVFKYARIEFCGYRFQLNNEINGLTLGAVGAATELHHVQVSYSFDDSFEFFGGTVSATHLVVFGGTDDELDFDFGYRGKIQYVFAIRDEFNWDPTGESRGTESDNDGSGTLTTPITQAVVTNATIIGPERINSMVPPPVGHTYDYSAVVRRCAQTSFYNSVIMGYPFGLSMRNTCTQDSATAGVVQWRNVSIQATKEKVVASGSVHDQGNWAGVTTWFDTPAYSNLGSAPRNPDTMQLNDVGNLFDPDPRPLPTSELITSPADFVNPNLAGCEVTTYRGAFPSTADAQKHELWYRTFANFDPQNADYDCGDDNTTTAAKPVTSAIASLGQNYPNPFNPQTSIDYTVRAIGHVTIEVFTARGELVSTLVDAVVNPGSHTVVFNATGVGSGIYFYRLTGNGVSETRKMVLLK